MPLGMLVLFLAASTLQAEEQVPVRGAHIDMQHAEQAYAEMRFDDCRLALDRALRNPDNTRDNLIKIYRLRGLVEAAVGQPVAAKRAFSNMIVLDPQVQLKDEYAPKIMRTYETARASLPGEKGLALHGVSHGPILMGKQAQILIRVDDTLAMVDQLVLRFRVDQGAYQQRILTRADQGVLRIPARLLPLREQNYALEVEAVAQNAYGANLAEMHPALRIEVVPKLIEARRPWYRQWWIWASLSAGIGTVALVGISSVLLLSPQDTRPRDVQVVLQ